jgi:hypothetical protein
MRLCGKPRPKRGTSSVHGCRGLRVAQRHAARKNSGSRAANNLVRVQSKGVWKRGWDAGVLALHRNLRVTAGSFRDCPLSCADRDRVARETGQEGEKLWGAVC